MLISEIIGQVTVKTTLLQAAKEGRVSHALLFFGPRGSGVLPMARAFAQYLTCTNQGEFDSCGKCSSCLKNSKLVHPDVHFSFPVVTDSKRGIKKPISNDYIAEFRQIAISHPYFDYNDWVPEIADSENKQAVIYVHEASEIIRKINLKAFESPYKVMIIWLPERMNMEVANKLLKSFEEPPSNTVFILATEQRDQIIQTILSRTQLIKIHRIEDEEIENALIHRRNLSSQAAHEIAMLSDGDFHLALELSNREEGIGNHEAEFLAWMRLCFNPMKTMEQLLAWVESIAGKGREGQKQFLFACIQTVRECMMINLADPSLVKIDPHQQKTLERFLPFVNQFNMTPFVNELNQAYYHIERNANGKILFLDLSLKISKILQIKQLADA